MKRLLVDLTEIENITSTPGGIPRVVYQLAKYFYLHKAESFELRFIIFDAHKKVFFYTNFEPVYNRIEKITPKPAKPVAIPKRSVVVKAVKKAQHIVNPPRPPKPEEVVFSSNDTILVMGKPWDNPDVQTTLVRQKAKSHFRLVQVVYDLIVTLYPHLQNPVLYEPFTMSVLQTVKYSDLLLSISKSTAHDIEKFCKQHDVMQPPTKVIRLGDDIVDASKKRQGKRPNDDIRPEFIACVGTIEIRKNHALLYYAYKLAEQKGIELPQLVIVGSQGWLTSEVQYLINNDPVMKDKIIMLNNVSDEELAWIYFHCLFTIYPSMYEGWGLPIAESIAYDKLCVSSNTSSMPEIAGKLIDYFSPYDAGQCLEKIVEYSGDKQKLQQKVKDIKTSYEPVSWKATHLQIVKCLNR